MKRLITIIVGLLVIALIGCNSPLISDDEEGDDNGEPQEQAGVEQPDLEGEEQPDYRTLIRVPGGAFLQEDRFDDSFEHTISDFDMAQYEVTYELWYTVREWAEDNGYTFGNAGTQGNNGGTGVESGGRRHEPVTELNWYDVVVWANAYSQMAGLDPVYYLDSAHTDLATDATAEPDVENEWVDWSASGYRLPTEGEWQYAASYQNENEWTLPDWPSGGNDAYDGDNENNEEVAWFSANSGDKSQPVGDKKANQLGMYDMSGNVWEWTWDWHASDYPAEAKTDYRGPSDGLNRVVRGGGWSLNANYLQVGMRRIFSPSYADSYLGFRIVRTQ